MDILDRDPSYRQVRDKVHTMIDEMCGRVVAEQAKEEITLTPILQLNEDDPESAIDQLKVLYDLAVSKEPTVPQNRHHSQYFQYLKTVLSSYPELVSEAVQMLKAWNDEQKKKIAELERSLRTLQSTIDRKDKEMIRQRTEMQSMRNAQTRHDLQIAGYEKKMLQLQVSLKSRPVSLENGATSELIALRGKVEILETENIDLRRKIAAQIHKPPSRPQTATVRSDTSVPVRTTVMRRSSEEPGLGAKDVLGQHEVPTLQRKVAKLDAELTETVARLQQHEREIFSKNMQLRDARALTKRLTAQLDSTRRELHETSLRFGELIKARNKVSHG